MRAVVPPTRIKSPNVAATICQTARPRLGCNANRLPQLGQSVVLPTSSAMYSFGAPHAGHLQRSNMSDSRTGKSTGSLAHVRQRVIREDPLANRVALDQVLLHE